MKWQEFIRSYDERRDIAIPGDNKQAIEFCVEQFIAIAKHSIETNGIFTAALSGGSTPKAIYQKLAEDSYRKQVDWKKVLLFWSDERCVPPDDTESNYHMAMTNGMETLPIPKENIFRMEGEKDPEKAAERYEQLIRQKVPSTSFDLIMLGMGEDGHTASLFPKTHGLHADNLLVTANFIPQKHIWRLTLTFECINNSKNISIYVLGKAKAEMLKKVLSAPYDPDALPSQKVGTAQHKALWIADKDAAQDLC